MKRFEVVFFVDAPNLREAKATARQYITYGTTPAEFVESLINDLREVKPPKQQVKP